MKKYNTGLVVGKFCPLHYGHIYVIEEALKQCERLIILSYTSQSFPGCSSDDRVRWFKELYSTANNITVRILDDDPDRPDDLDAAEVHRGFVGRELDRLETTVQAVFHSEDYGQGLAESLKYYFLNMFSNRSIYSSVDKLMVDSVCVDINRQKYPISGTEIRKSIPWQNVPSTVASSSIPRIAIVGAESTGKSTLVKALSEYQNFYAVDEFGRTLCEVLGGVDNLMYEDLKFIGVTQIEGEEIVASRALNHFQDNIPIVVCDTTPVTTAFYSSVLFGRVSKELSKLIQRSYNIVFVCDINTPFINDGTRTEEIRSLAEKFYKTVYPDAILLTGTTQNRVEQVFANLKRNGLINYEPRKI